MSETETQPDHLTIAHETCRIGIVTAQITWPEPLTPEEYDDLEYWLTRVLHKARRSVKVTEATDEEATHERD